MNETVKAIWVAALESGEFKQGRLQLRSKDDKYCCLGVLCQLAVEAGVIDEPKTYSGGYVYANQVSFMPNEVKNWAGLHGDLIKLINMNDGDHNRFKTIAKYIKEYL